MKIANAVMLISLLASTQVSAGSRQDGVVLDHDGLTIRLNVQESKDKDAKNAKDAKAPKAIAVDTARWNLANGVYTNKNDGAMVNVITDEKGDVKGILKSNFSGENENGYYAKDIILSEDNDLDIITTAFCKEFEKKDILKTSKECAKIDSDLEAIFLKQYDDKENIYKVAELTDEKISKVSADFKDIVTELKVAFSKKPAVKVDEKLINTIVLACNKLERFSVSDKKISFPGKAFKAMKSLVK